MNSMPGKWPGNQPQLVERRSARKGALASALSRLALIARGAGATQSPMSNAQPDNRLVYAIGDIHGRLDLLDPLIRSIANDVLLLRPHQRPILVFLGDYVDRGLESRGVIDRIIWLCGLPAFEVHAVKGNHEDAMLAFLRDARSGRKWMEFGGAQTLASYGVIPPRPSDGDAEWERVREEFSQYIPPSHIAFLTNLKLKVSVGDYMFVHAGLRPGIDIEDQDEHDLMWIRDEFTNADNSFGKVIVHGHTANARPFIGTNRIGVDTGAYFTGVLSAVRLVGDTRAVLQSKLY
jgi:serine/threonine protein phosphatase 1